MTPEAESYHVHISPRHRLLDLHLWETFKYRDLILLLVWRDFSTQYKQTVLGPLWAIITPLLTSSVFTVIFGKLAGLTTADAAEGPAVPRFLFYLAGSICWGYFSRTLNATSNTFLNNRGTMGKVYYPRLVVPVSAALSRLISFGIQFALLAVLLVFNVRQGDAVLRLTPWLLLLPLLILQMAFLSVGCGIIISSVTTKYRDLAMLTAFGLQLWQYASPVAYGFSLVPTRWQALYVLNPMTPILTTFRHAVFGTGYFDLRSYLISWAISLLLFFIGLILFSHVERSFIDTI